MTWRSAFLRVGLLVLVGIGAIVAVLLFLTRNQITDGAHYETYFRESVQGLDVGSPVKFRGVALGQVTEVGLVSTLYMLDQPPDARRATVRLVYVRFVIDPKRVGRLPDHQSAVNAGLRARLASQGLTGLAYLELDFVDPAKFPPLDVPWTPRDTYIPSMPSTITQVQDAAQTLLAKVGQVDIVRLGDGVQTVLDDLHRQLDNGDAHHALVEATALLATLRAAIANADLPGLAAEIRATAAAARGVVQSKQTRDLLASAARAADRFSDAAARLPALIAALQATVQRANDTTADLAADLVPILRDTQAAASNLRATSEVLRRYPASILLGGPPPRETPK